MKCLNIKWHLIKYLGSATFFNLFDPPSRQSCTVLRHTQVLLFSFSPVLGFFFSSSAAKLYAANLQWAKWMTREGQKVRYLYRVCTKIEASWHRINIVPNVFHLSWRSAAAISVKDSNGTFISTLNLLLYNVSSHPLRPKFLLHYKAIHELRNRH